MFTKLRWILFKFLLEHKVSSCQHVQHGQIYLANVKFTGHNFNRNFICLSNFVHWERRVVLPLEVPVQVLPLCTWKFEVEEIWKFEGVLLHWNISYAYFSNISLIFCLIFFQSALLCSNSWSLYFFQWMYAWYFLSLVQMCEQTRMVMVSWCPNVKPANQVITSICFWTLYCWFQV